MRIMINNYKVGIYLRLSREDEKTGESGSITNQRSILLDYINKNNLKFIDEYVDDGVSGTTFDRSGFKKMICDIEDKKINMVITKDTSRLGRDHIEFGYYVEKYFPEHNVRYVAVCDNIDTSTNNNDMLLFKSAYNDLYVKDISNKIRASLNIKKRNGEFVGAYAPYGYKKDIHNKHKLVIDEEAAGVVRKIFDLFIKGNSITSIANKLTKEGVVIPSIYKNMNRGIKSSLFGIWHQRTVSDILTNPTYMGDLTQGRCKKVNYKSKKRIHTRKDDWIVVCNSCPVIIDRKVFELANKMYSLNKNKSQKKNNLLFKGLVYCKECGHRIGFRSINNDKFKTYGACNYYLKHKFYNVCSPHKIKYVVLERIVLGEIEKLLSLIDYDYIWSELDKIKKNKFIDDKGKQITSLKKEIELLDIKVDRLYDDRLSGLIDKEMYLKKYNQLIKDKDNIEKEINKILNCNTKEIDFRKEFKKFLSNINNDRCFVSSVISSITYSEDRVINIYFRIKDL